MHLRTVVSVAPVVRDAVHGTESDLSHDSIPKSAQLRQVKAFQIPDAILIKL